MRHRYLQLSRLKTGNLRLAGQLFTAHSASPDTRLIDISQGVSSLLAITSLNAPRPNIWWPLVTSHNPGQDGFAHGKSQILHAGK